MIPLFCALVLAAPVAPRTEIASGTGAASAEVEGPVSFTLRSYAAEVEISVSPRQRLSVAVQDRTGIRVALVSAGGHRIEAEFGRKRQLHDGKVRVEVPRGTSLDVSAVTGAITVSGVGGSARVRGMSGAVQIAGATDVDVETVDGPIAVTGAAGALRLHTTSGNARVETGAPGARVEVETSSGAVSFRGPCSKGCHLDVDSVSGEVRFALAADSSFAASVISTSGKVRDELGIGVREKEGVAEAGWSEGHYREGDGLIECETFSGNVTFAPAAPHG